MPSFHLDDAELYYEDYGDGPPLVFLHGAGGNSLVWWRQVAVFARQYRVIVFDQRGFGRTLSQSKVKEGNAPALSADLEALLDVLKIKTAAALIGHSLGTHPALDFAQRQPDRVGRVVLSGAYGGLISPQLQNYAANRLRMLDELRFAEKGSGRERLMRRLSPYSEHTRERAADLIFLMDRIAAIGPTPPIEQLRAFLETSRPIDVAAATTMPQTFLLLGGAEDRLMPPDELQAAASILPRASFHAIKDAGHAAFLEQPESFNRAIADFLAGKEQ